jgi:hypothetical protein
MRQNCSISKFVGFGVLTAAITRSTVFWDVMTCSLVDIHKLLGGT